MRFRAGAVLLALAAAAGSGCNSNPGALGDVQVATANITGVQWASIDAVVGVSWATGVLHIVDSDGGAHEAQVNISGPAFGAAADISAGDFASTTMALNLPPKTIHGSDLFDTYFGSDQAAHILVGGEQHDLTNSAGVRLTSGNFDLGLGLFVGAEWLTISLVDGGSG